MATLVLTAVGSALGGPLGGAVGAVLGQAADARLFAPAARQGPRLASLAVQTSTYGGDIPKLFGRIRVAGTVIWSTDLIEEKSVSGGGKGRAKTVDYAYSASFAVLISARPVRSVGRIWADGKLLRGAAGDFKTATGFRLWTGSEDQPPDPLIASAEGASGTPAYRGCAYAVFEDLQLADFGNRIPSLTFEVLADEGAVGAADIAVEIAGGGVAGSGGPPMLGYAAAGETLRGAIEPLAEACGLALRASPDGLSLVAALVPGAAETVVETGASADGSRARTERVRGGGPALPGEVSLSYYEVERDYQAGLQRATRPGGRGGERLSLAAVLSAADAKALCAARLARLAASRETLRVHLGPRWLGLRPGATIRLAGVEGLWRVERLLVERLVVAAELVRLGTSPAVAAAGAPGRSLSEPDAPAGPSELLVFEGALDGEVLAAPRVLVAAAGASQGWRPVPLSASYDGGESWVGLERRGRAAVLGRTLTPLPAAGSGIFDDASVLDVELLRDSDWLESRIDAALGAGANAARAGDELIQFGRAEPLGGGRFRLSHLLRGRRGTEWAAGGAGAGSAFLLLGPSALVAIEPGAGSVGSEVRIASEAPADDAAEPVVHAVSGEGLAPPSPVHLRGSLRADGGLDLAWVRRSRAGWSWGAGADAPLVEEREAYRVTLSGAGVAHPVEVAEPRLALTAAETAAMGLAPPIAVAVVQLGTHAVSRAASIIVG